MKGSLKIASLLVLFLLAVINGLTAAAAVTVSPSSAQVNLGQQLQFTATVSGSSNSVVIWSTTGAGCTGTACGQITADGLYTAPLTAPNPAIVTVRATSLADPSQSGTATVSVGKPLVVAVSISPTRATIAVHGQQQFQARVTGSANTAVKWSVAGGGTISPSGLYTAPGTVPRTGHATVTATSVANPSKSASATVTIESASSVAVIVSPAAAQVTTGGHQQFIATVKGSTNTAVVWHLSGAGCSGATCGTISSSGFYTAPSTVPSSPKVTVSAQAVADPARSGTASVTIVKGSALIISPSATSVKPGGQVQFSATASSGSNVVIWSVAGPGCAGIFCGFITSSGLYTAPATAPTPPTVTVTATLLSNPSISASAVVTITTNGPISVTVSPDSVTLNPGAKQQFKATVQGTSNTAVTWSVTGFGCGGADCGTITAGGLYTAPATPPNPSFVNVIATSVADPTKQGSATVTISTVIAVSISPQSAQVIAGGQRQFTASVTGTTNTAVTWSVAGTGCTGAGCGTITSGGLYTAPVAIPSPAQVTVTAVANADGKTSASATVTIISPVVVTVSPTHTIVSVGQQIQFQETVEGTKIPGVTWSVSGTGCSGSACGTITSTGLYTAPATAPNPAVVIVTATAKADSSRTASAIVTIAPSNNSKLIGPYAFQFMGFDANGVYQSVGSFNSDGNGKLSGGLEDINKSAGPSTSVKFTGTYQVGNDNRGIMTFNSASGTHTFRIALDELGKKGRFIEFDSSGVRGSGVIKRQDPTAFDPSAFANGYVFSLAGMDMASLRIGGLGLIFLDGTGFISGASLDINDGGSVSPTFGSFNGSYNVAPSGRGTVTLNIPGFGGGVFNFALYVVSANELFLQSIDPLSVSGQIFGGPAEVQTGAPFLSSSFKGPSLFNLSGVTGTSSADDLVGQLLFTGGSGVTDTFDENKGGQVTIGGELTGAFSLQLNGRGTLNLSSTTGAPTIWYVYATAPNQGFLMDASSAAVGVGDLQPQLEISPLSNSAILGTYLFGSGEPTVRTAPLFSGVSSFDGGADHFGQGVVTGTEDISTSGANTPSVALAGKYNVSTVSNNGRGAILLTLPSGETIAVWVVNAGEVVGLDVDSSEIQPTILHYQQ